MSVNAFIDRRQSDAQPQTLKSPLPASIGSSTGLPVSTFYSQAVVVRRGNDPLAVGVERALFTGLSAACQFGKNGSLLTPETTGVHYSAGPRHARHGMSSAMGAGGTPRQWSSNDENVSSEKRML